MAFNLSPVIMHEAIGKLHAMVVAYDEETKDDGGEQREFDGFFNEVYDFIEWLKTESIIIKRPRREEK